MLMSKKLVSSVVIRSNQKFGASDFNGLTYNSVTERSVQPRQTAVDFYEEGFLDNIEIYLIKKRIQVAILLFIFCMIEVNKKG